MEFFENLTSKFPEVQVQTYNNWFPVIRYKIKDDYTELLKRFDCNIRNLLYTTKEERERSAAAINVLVAGST